MPQTAHAREVVSGHRRHEELVHLLQATHHHLGGFALGITICCANPGVGNQAIAVVSQGVARVAQFTVRVAHSVQACISVSAAAPALEVAPVIVAAVFAGKALVTGPGPIDGIGEFETCKVLDVAPESQLEFPFELPVRTREQTEMIG